MRRLVMATLALALATGPAAALTCMRSDPVWRFGQAAAAPQSYVVVHGAFAFDPARMPQTGTGAEGRDVPARFTGKMLRRDGFVSPTGFPVTLHVECAGPWCGTMDPRQLHLAFVEKRADGYHLSVGACAVDYFENPEPAVLEQMRSCLVRGC